MLSAANHLVGRVLCAMGFLAALGMTSGVAHADATPTQVVLVSMPNVSTTNTPAASGIAELVLQEGEVRISVTDLPHLDSDGQYVAWVVDTDSNAFLRLGAFNTGQSTGAAHFETVLPDNIPTTQHWNLVLVTIENTSTPDHPGPAHSIAGMFPAAGSDLVPELLPNTGGADDDNELPVASRESRVAGSAGLFRARRWADWLPILGAAALTLGLGSGAGFVLGRRSTRDSRPATRNSRP